MYLKETAVRNHSEIREFYVYLHKRPDGRIFYVGKGKARRAWSSENRNQHWHNIVNKYGSFDVEIIEDCLTEQESLEKEIEKIREIGLDNLANKTLGGGGVSGHKHSEDSRERMRASHKRLLEENPAELQRRIDVLNTIHEKVRADPERRKAISERNSAWWKNAPEDTLNRLSAIRSINATSMWSDESKKEEISLAIKQAFADMPNDVKVERSRKLSEAGKRIYENMSEEQKSELHSRVRFMKTPEAIEKYKEARLRKLVINRLYIIESRAEFCRLLGKGISNINSSSNGYQVHHGYFIEDFDPELHKHASEISTLDGIEVLYPLNGNSRAVYNSRGEVFLSLQEAADSIINSKATVATKTTSITSACTEGVNAYGAKWFKATEDMIESEIFKRLNKFIEEKLSNG